MAPKISTVAHVAKASARAMKTTERVGDPGEDASMARARPILAEINALGFVTTDSQMGKRYEFVASYGKDIGFDVVSWQRGYVDGFMERKAAWAFATAMDLVGGAVVFVRDHAKKPPTDAEWAKAYRIPVTRYSERDGTFPAPTNMPLMSFPLEDQWINLLPETGLRSDMDAMRRVAPDAVHVSVVDMQWGRSMWLFKKVLEVLSGKGPTTPLATKKKGHKA